MDSFNSWTQLFTDSLLSIWNKIVLTFPSLFGALLIFLVGWIIAKLVSRFILKLLNLGKFNDLAERINANNLLEKANIKSTPSQLLSKIVYWIIILIVFLTLAESLGWHTISEEISKLLAYIPKLFIAIVIFLIGSFIAGFVRDIIAGATDSLGISSGKILSSLVYYILMIIISLTALRQAGIDTSFISSNVLLILGAILISVSISYGFASRDILSNILSGFVARNTYKMGMEIEVTGIRGTIIDSDSIGITLRTVNQEKIVIPSSTLIKNNVRIISEPNIK